MIYSQIKNNTSDQICHCIQVGTYKRFDDYAKQLGLRNLNISPSVLTIIYPEASLLNRVQVFWDPVLGAKYLTWLRNNRK